MTEIPSEKMMSLSGHPDRTREITPLTEGDLLGEHVFFVTNVGAWPAVVVAYDNTTKEATLQVWRKKADGSDLVKGIKHISSGKVPCWAWRHETPMGGIHSPQPPKRAHGRFDTGGIRV